MIDLSPQWVAVGVSVIALVASGAAWWFALWNRGRKAIERRIDDMEHRLTVIDVTVRSLPTSLSWSEMQKDIAAIRGDGRTTSAQIEGLGAGLKRVERQIGLLMEHELRGKSQS